MNKMNARYKKSDKKEHANKNGKKFYCSNCKITKTIKAVEFGEDVICQECGRTMEEL